MTFRPFFKSLKSMIQKVQQCVGSQTFNKQ